MSSIFNFDATCLTVGANSFEMLTFLTNSSSIAASPRFETCFIPSRVFLGFVDKGIPAVPKANLSILIDFHHFYIYNPLVYLLNLLDFHSLVF